MGQPFVVRYITSTYWSARGPITSDSYVLWSFLSTDNGAAMLFFEVMLLRILSSLLVFSPALVCFIDCFVYIYIYIYITYFTLLWVEHRCTRFTSISPVFTLQHTAFQFGYIVKLCVPQKCVQQSDRRSASSRISVGWLPCDC